MMPVAAAFLIAVGVIRYEHRPQPPLANAIPVIHSSQPVTVLADDDLNEINAVPAARRVAFETGLRNVNAYIRDAEESAKANPNDEEAQAYLMNAYEQKAMVFEMAMDRSQP